MASARHFSSRCTARLESLHEAAYRQLRTPQDCTPVIRGASQAHYLYRKRGSQRKRAVIAPSENANSLRENSLPARARPLKVKRATHGAHGRGDRSPAHHKSTAPTDAGNTDPAQRAATDAMA